MMKFSYFFHKSQTAKIKNDYVCKLLLKLAKNDKIIKYA